jgi:hypothetical protein
MLEDTMMKKTVTRKIADKIQIKTGQSLVVIHHQAMKYVELGLSGIETREDALNYMLEVIG